jgi:tRNA uridine 5-carbamoylmethylation protein Kti12
VTVIADSLNYIKGFRYELYCVARALKTPHCCVHVTCSGDVARAWDAARGGGAFGEALYVAARAHRSRVLRW